MLGCKRQRSFIVFKEVDVVEQLLPHHQQRLLVMPWDQRHRWEDVHSRLQACRAK
jgi:hypothetical protein